MNRTEASGQGAGGRGQGKPGRASPAGAVGWGLLVWFVLALLTLPLFAHGCHGDDVDHEPLFVPLRLNGDDQE